MANRRTHPLPEFLPRHIGNFADCETCRRKFKIKKRRCIQNQTNFSVPAEKKNIKPAISRTTKNHD
jgi:hypothetical protein